MILEERKRRNRNPNIGIGGSLYPSSTGGRGTADGDTTDEVFYDCKQCGFPCLASRVQSPGGTDDGKGGVNVVSSDPQITPGYCPNCGSANSKA